MHDQLWCNDDIYLEIGPLRIQLLSGNTASYPTVSAHNPLRDYYLNIDNLNNTDANDVELLLGKFWQRFVRNDERHNALEELGLKPSLVARILPPRCVRCMRRLVQLFNRGNLDRNREVMSLTRTG